MMRSRHTSRVRSWSRHTKAVNIHCLSRKDSHRHQRDWGTLRIWSVVGLHQKPGHSSNLKKECVSGTNDDGELVLTAIMRHW